MTLVSSPATPRGRQSGAARLAQAVGPVNDTGNLPLYQQLQRALREAIDRRILDANDALPAERDLAEEFGVSRITVRKAIDGLVSEGLLMRRQGSGTFVRGRVEKNFSLLTSFSEDMRARGRNPRSEWLKRTSGTVTPEEALTLRSSPGTPVYRFHRLRFADDAPMSVEYATIVATCLPSRALQRLRAVLLTREQASLLCAQPGDAGLLVERVGFLANGRAIEFSLSYYRGDTYDFVAELGTSR
jgi:GntR family transcriptional regulator